MRPDVARALDRVAAGARADGAGLLIVSAFRSDAEQAVLFASPRTRSRSRPPGRSLHRDATEPDPCPRSAHGWLGARRRAATSCGATRGALAPRVRDRPRSSRAHRRPGLSGGDSGSSRPSQALWCVAAPKHGHALHRRAYARLGRRGASGGIHRRRRSAVLVFAPLHGNASAHGRALARLRAQVQGAADERDALAHADQAESVGRPLRHRAAPLRGARCRRGRARESRSGAAGSARATRSEWLRGRGRGQTLGLMQRRQRRDRLQLGAQPIVDPRRRAPVAAVHDPVRDGVRRAQRDRVRRLARPGRRRCRGHRTRGSRALVACVEQVQLDAAQRGGARRRRDLGRRRRRASAVILACEDYRDGAPGARRARTMLNPRLLRESRRAAVPACG